MYLALLIGLSITFTLGLRQLAFADETGILGEIVESIDRDIRKIPDQAQEASKRAFEHFEEERRRNACKSIFTAPTRILDTWHGYGCRGDRLVYEFSYYSHRVYLDIVYEDAHRFYDETISDPEGTIFCGLVTQQRWNDKGNWSIQQITRKGFRVTAYVKASTNIFNRDGAKLVVDINYRALQVYDPTVSVDCNSQGYSMTSAGGMGIPPDVNMQCNGRSARCTFGRDPSSHLCGVCIEGNFP